MAKHKQFIFDGFGKIQDAFGGSLLKNSHAKTTRPLDSKLPVHLVLKCHKSVLRLPKTLALVDKQVEIICKKHGIRLYSYANVGNHLHLLLKLARRRRWAAFIRELTGRIAQLMRERLGLVGAFWVQRPFTRIVRGWRKAFRIVREYVQLNRLEAENNIRGEERRLLRELRLRVRGFG